MRPILRVIALGTAFALGGCSETGSPPATLTLATTTSTQDSGLLDALLPVFRRQTGLDVKLVAVGSGQALELGRRGDADVLLTHAPAAEEAFMAEGFGLLRRHVMHNDFVLLGPPIDPAGVAPEAAVTEAFARIARKEAAFVSRGDESGTHKTEQSLWHQAGIEPRGDWYIRSGVGMAQALRMADELRAYVLCDRATFLAQRGRLRLAVLVAGDSRLENHYSVIVVHPRKHPRVRHEAACRFAEFLLRPETQSRIADFGKARFGEPLFFPNPVAR